MLKGHRSKVRVIRMRKKLLFPLDQFQTLKQYISHGGDTQFLCLSKKLFDFTKTQKGYYTTLDFHITNADTMKHQSFRVAL